MAAQAEATVAAWRMEQFLGMGCDVPLADHLADTRVDLDEMRKLIERGCDPQTAAAILD